MVGGWGGGGVLEGSYVLWGGVHRVCDVFLGGVCVGGGEERRAVCKNKTPIPFLSKQCHRTG